MRDLKNNEATFHADIASRELSIVKGKKRAAPMTASPSYTSSAQLYIYTRFCIYKEFIKDKEY